MSNLLWISALCPETLVWTDYELSSNR